jgi:hypothetical protein
MNKALSNVPIQFINYFILFFFLFHLYALDSVILNRYFVINIFLCNNKINYLHYNKRKLFFFGFFLDISLFYRLPICCLSFYEMPSYYIKYLRNVCKKKYIIHFFNKHQALYRIPRHFIYLIYYTHCR